MANHQDVSTGIRWATVTPSDSANFTETPRAIYVGITGDVAAVGSDGVASTFKNVAGGTMLPIAPVRINTTNTTATNMLAIY